MSDRYGDDRVEDVLDAFVASAAGPGGADLATWIGRFPDYEQELTRCATSWRLVQAMATGPDPSGPTDDILVGRGMEIVGELLRQRESIANTDAEPPARVRPAADPPQTEERPPSDDPAGMLHRVREQLLYSVAHEVRGPLTVLDNALELLSTNYAELTAEEFGNLLDQARRTTGRLRTLMDDLLNAGTVESGHFVVTPRPTPLGEIVDDALELMAHSTEARRQHVELSLGREALWVQADRRYARQVLSNLLANASKYSPERSLIRVAARGSAGTVIVEVADQGPGIAPEHLPYVFERFYRVRTGGEEPGVGLGLAIAKSIVEAHGGHIGINSTLGSGTRAWFSLPAAGQGHADPLGG